MRAILAILTHSCVRVRRLSTRVKLRGIGMRSAQTNVEVKKMVKSIGAAIYGATSIHPLVVIWTGEIHCQRLIASEEPL